MTTDLTTDVGTELVAGRPDWMLAAACRGLDPELFFPPRGAPTDHAKAVCARCTVTAECLEYSLDGGEHHGIWGGKSERERRSIRRVRVRPKPIVHGTDAGYNAAGGERAVTETIECATIDVGLCELEVRSALDRNAVGAGDRSLAEEEPGLRPDRELVLRGDDRRRSNSDGDHAPTLRRAT